MLDSIFNNVWNKLSRLNEDFTEKTIAEIKARLVQTSTVFFFEDVLGNGAKYGDVELEVSDDEVAEVLVNFIKDKEPEVVGLNTVDLWKYVETHFHELVDKYKYDIEENWYQVVVDVATDNYADACDRAYDEWRDSGVDDIDF